MIQVLSFYVSSRIPPLIPLEAAPSDPPSLRAAQELDRRQPLHQHSLGKINKSINKQKQSLAAQSDHRINFRRPPRRNVTGQHRHQRQ